MLQRPRRCQWRRTGELLLHRRRSAKGLLLRPRHHAGRRRQGAGRWHGSLAASKLGFSLVVRRSYQTPFRLNARHAGDPCHNFVGEPCNTATCSCGAAPLRKDASAVVNRGKQVLQHKVRSQADLVQGFACSSTDEITRQRRPSPAVAGLRREAFDPRMAPAECRTRKQAAAHCMRRDAAAAPGKALPGVDETLLDPRAGAGTPCPASAVPGGGTAAAGACPPGAADRRGCARGAGLGGRGLTARAEVTPPSPCARTRRESCEGESWSNAVLTALATHSPGPECWGGGLCSEAGFRQRRSPGRCGKAQALLLDCRAGPLGALIRVIRCEPIVVHR